MLGELTVEDVRVEMYTGKVDARGEITEPRITQMTPIGSTPDGAAMYKGDVDYGAAAACTATPCGCYHTTRI